MTKVCKKCGSEKSISDFYTLTNQHTKDGLFSKCKPCMLEEQRIYRNANKEKVSAKAKAWREKNPERNRENCRKAEQRNKEKRRAQRLKRYYGISFAEYQDLIEQQKGLCKICGRDPLKVFLRSSSYCVDHDHETGKVRGILCGKCNAALGMLQDSPEILRKAAEYIESFKGGD